MRNRLIAAILGLFGTLTGVQAAPDVTSEITYDLASGRADYYFWKDEASAGMDICGMNVILTSNKPVQLMEISTVQIYLTEQRSGMRWPVKLKGFKTASIISDEAPPGCKGGKGLQTDLKDSNRSSCTEDGQHYYIYDTKFLTLYLEQTEMKNLPNWWRLEGES
ncbi:CfaE/CblD family pilus tip adhesin [Escherichia coli]